MKGQSENIWHTYKAIAIVVNIFLIILLKWNTNYLTLHVLIISIFKDFFIFPFKNLGFDNLVPFQK